MTTLTKFRWIRFLLVVLNFVPLALGQDEAPSDDRGEFRIEDLPASYHIRVTAPALADAHAEVVIPRGPTIPLSARSFVDIAYLAPGTEPVEPSDPSKLALLLWPPAAARA